jgi:hypothetical protein
MRCFVADSIAAAWWLPSGLSIMHLAAAGTMVATSLRGIVEEKKTKK